MTTPIKKKKPRTPERLPAESASAYRAFCIYRDLGSNRTLDLAWRNFRLHPPTGKVRKWSRHPGCWGVWSVEFNWVKRAETHDELIEEERFASAANQRQELEQRRLKFEIESQTANENSAWQLDLRVDRVLKAPIHDFTTEKYDVVTHTRTTTKIVGAKGKDIVALMKARNEAFSLAILGVRGDEEEEDPEDEGQVTRIVWERPKEHDEDEEDEQPDDDGPKVEEPYDPRDLDTILKGEDPEAETETETIAKAKAKEKAA
jgi:hypothetical protein